MDAYAERRSIIAHCAKTLTGSDEEEEIMVRLFRAQTRCEKRKWLAWREGRTDAYGEWYATPPLNDFALVWTDKEKKEVLRREKAEKKRAAAAKEAAKEAAKGAEAEADADARWDGRQEQNRITTFAAWEAAENERRKGLTLMDPAERARLNALGCNLDEYGEVMEPEGGVWSCGIGPFHPNADVIAREKAEKKKKKKRVE